MGVVSVQSAIGKYISGISILIRIYGFKNLVDIISAAIGAEIDPKSIPAYSLMMELGTKELLWS